MPSGFSFKLLATDKASGARLGEMNLPRGQIHTPVFMPVGTLATVKTLTPEELRETPVILYNEAATLAVDGEWSRATVVLAEAIDAGFSDLGVIGDLNKILPKLTEAVKAKKGS